MSQKEVRIKLNSIELKVLGVAVLGTSLYAIGGREGWYGFPTSAANERYTPADFIPEFPSWIILPLFVIATLAVVIYRNRLRKS